MTIPKFLFFDFGNVLYYFDHEIAVKNLAQLANSEADKVRSVVFDSGIQSRYETGQLSTAEFCQRFRDETGADATDAEICVAASDIFRSNHSIFPLIASLKLAGCRIGVLSNTCEIHWDFVKHNSLIRLFDVHVLSFQNGHAKPNRQIYDQAAEQVNLEAAELFFVDDLAANVQGAIDAGFQAIVYKSAQQLADELRARGVAFN